MHGPLAGERLRRVHLYAERRLRGFTAVRRLGELLVQLASGAVLLRYNRIAAVATAACGLWSPPPAQRPDSAAAQPAARKVQRLPTTLVTDSAPRGRASLRTITVTCNQLARVSGDPDELLAYLRALAGVVAGGERIYVDGMAADALPPVERIERVTVDADPFSAEFSDAGQVRIEVTTRELDRAWSLRSAGVSPPVRTPNGLDPRLKSSRSSGSAELSGPMPLTTVSFAADIALTNSRREEPLLASVPDIASSAVSTNGEASTVATERRRFVAFSAELVPSDDTRLSATMYLDRLRQSNANLSALTLSEAGGEGLRSGDELRLALSHTGSRVAQQAGFSITRSSDRFDASSEARGIVVPGAFIAGGAPFSASGDRRLRWSLKHVARFTALAREWRVGGVVEHVSDNQLLVPNVSGSVTFEDLSAYSASVARGAATGTATWWRGVSDASRASWAVMPFVETDLYSRSWLAVRGGLRADAQAGGALVSPRLSATATVREFRIAAGTGRFAHRWDDHALLRATAVDGVGLSECVVTRVSVGAAWSAADPGSCVVSANATDLAVARDWTSRFSIERAFGALSLGSELANTSSLHLMGLRRVPSGSGWTDLLESNRSAQRQELRSLARYYRGGVSLSVQHVWVRSFDDTDGPFSYAARSDDLGPEWGRTAGVAPQNVIVTGTATLGETTSLGIVESWHGASAMNITTGRDPLGSGLFMDRGGLARNAGWARAFNSCDLVAWHRFELPALLGLAGPHLDARLRVANLLGNTNPVTLGGVIGSPAYRQALSAGPGRTLALAFTF